MINTWAFSEIRTESQRDRLTLQDVVSLFKSSFQVSSLDGSGCLIEGLGSDGLLSIKPTAELELFSYI